MLFNSYEFIFYFLPALLVGYFVLFKIKPDSFVLQFFLAIGSVIFYLWRGVDSFYVLFTSITINYFVGRILSSPNFAVIRRRLVVIAAVGFNLSLLVFFKYWNFLVSNLNGWANLEVPLSRFDLPLAISFFTFLQVAYIVDCYKHQQNERYDFLEYFLFVVFFPHLIAGPLVHHRALISQLRKLNSLSSEVVRNLSLGGSIFIVGLAKKVLLADVLAGSSNQVFDSAMSGTVGPSYAVLGLSCYTLQIYFDFSGYCDMAIGLSRMFGVSLPENFNSPYKSTSIIEFWRRWHMTLSQFLKDYLYIPLGGGRSGKSRRYVNLLITMILGGIWHGAGWNFLIWGALHGIYLCVNHFYRYFLKQTPRYMTVIHAILTMGGVMFAWIFFRAHDFKTAAHMIVSLLGSPNIAMAGQTISVKTLLVLGLATLVALIFPNTGEIFYRWKTPLASIGKVGWAQRLLWAPSAIWLIVVLILGFGSLIFMNRETAEFIYYKF